MVGKDISSGCVCFFFHFIKIYRDGGGGGGEVRSHFQLLLLFPLFTNCNFFILSFLNYKLHIAYNLSL